MVRRVLSLLAVVLLAASCAYESAGTTTTTEVVAEDQPPATGPAAISIVDQRIEGSSLVVDSATLPAPGFLIAREDDGGSPGAVIGVSELLPVGVVQDVPVPFFVPISEPLVVHVTVQIDMDQNGMFTYDPPEFVDATAVVANGEPASAVALLTLLAPLSPADAFLGEQTTDGVELTLVSATLPAPGFVAIQKNEGQQPGEILAITGLLAAGTYEDLEFELDPPLRTTQLVYAVAYVDRNENGIFDPGEAADDIGVRDDGGLAIGEAVITVFVRYPGAVTASDQEIEGDTVLLDAVDLPSPGFVEILVDAGGAPGVRLGVSELRQPGQLTDVTVTLEEALTEDTTLWVRLWIDYDESGELSAGDLQVLDDRGGDPVETSFEVTIAEE